MKYLFLSNKSTIFETVPIALVHFHPHLRLAFFYCLFGDANDDLNKDLLTSALREGS